MARFVSSLAAVLLVALILARLGAEGLEPRNLSSDLTGTVALAERPVAERSRTA
jgi:hypothetical protein